MYFLYSLYLPTLLVLFCFVFFSPPLPCLPTPPPLLILPFTVFFFFCSIHFFSISILALVLSLSTLLSPYSVTPPYSSRPTLSHLCFFIKMSFLFSSFFSLPHWSLSFSPSFFFPDRRPPSTPSFLIHSSFFTSFTPPPPPSPLHGSHFPFRSPLFPPIILFSLLSSLF